MITHARTRRDERRGAVSETDATVAFSCEGMVPFEVMFRRFRRLVYRVAVDILHDAAEAEDVTQDVFFEVFRKAHLYDPSRGSLKVWLLQYAYHRSLRRRDALRLRVAYQGEPIESADAVSRADPRELTRQEGRWVLRAGLSHLPDRQRRALELVWLEELTLTDVAERLRVSVGCARHYYYRGLAGLRSWAAVTAAGPFQSGQDGLDRHPKALDRASAGELMA